MTIDLRNETMRDFDASEGNTFSDYAIRCAVDGKVLLTKAQMGALSDHLDAVGSALDCCLWAYAGRYYEIDGGFVHEDTQAYWLTSSPFDRFLPAPDGSDDYSPPPGFSNDDWLPW